jgi:uncharacterized protein YndB with AHSA1/START domain
MTDAPHRHDSFTLEQVYPNCRDHVWAAWTVREKKAAWFGDPALEMDFRPGGHERTSFFNEMGRHVNETRYFEILEGERIVLAYSMAVNGRVHTVSLATLVFTDEGGGTRLSYTEQMCVIPPSDGAEGRAQGWGALLAALGDYLRTDLARPA